jgi:hypothetical protein
MGSRTVAIMQPTYLPWSGYFDLMDQCDSFVLLDCVQFDKRSWQQRNRIRTQHGALWLTVPVPSKGRRDQVIRDVEIDRESNFAERHIKTLQHHYRRSTYYERYIEECSAVLRKEHQYLADLNIELIEWFRHVLGIRGELIRSSALGVHGTKVERLIAICQAVGAKVYLSPSGARDYIEENNLFPEHGLELRYHAYNPPPYRQLYGEFVPYLSVLDLLFNEGDASLGILRAGRLVT